MSTVGVVGLGEAGRIYADAFAQAGHAVYGVDPAPTTTPDGVERVESLAGINLDFVLILTSARVAKSLAEKLLPELGVETIWVDMTTASPLQKSTLSKEGNSSQHVDIAILGPVISLGVSTPLMIAGEKAQDVADLFKSIDAPIEVIADSDAGDAMAHKLLRSIFMKGLAAIITEAVTAGKASGKEDWIRNQIALQLAGDGQAVVDRLLIGTIKHAARRADEMESVSSYLADLEVNNEMSVATCSQLTRLRDGDR